MTIFYVLVSVFIISILSLVGVAVIGIKEQTLRKVLLFLVAFSTGALIGDAFLHLIPEIVEEKGAFEISDSFALLAGILFFFALEKFLRWRHCHDIECMDHPRHLGIMNIVGDAFHNFIDGVLIAASYIVSIPLGIATTVAVALHEIPQELGDFGILLHSGFTKRRALLYNFSSALLAILGAVVALLVGQRVDEFGELAIPFTAGGFVYIALSGLIPELHRESNIGKSLLQFISIVAGISVMASLLLLE